MRNVLKILVASVCLISMIGCRPQSPKPVGGESPVEDTITALPILNVYVDNTGSMFGYISQGNEFEWALTNLLTSVTQSGFTVGDSIRLFYINSEIFPFVGDAPSFLKGVTRHNAQTYKGDLGKTCMSTFFKKVLERTSPDTVSIIISDFIISPGKGEDATNVLASEKYAITNAVSSKLQTQKNLTMAMYRLVSNFNGYFYDCNDDKKQINAERPFFMWVIGERNMIEHFREKAIESNIVDCNNKKLITNSFVFFRALSKAPHYIIRTCSDGAEILKEGEDRGHGLKKAKLQNGKFRFSIDVDLSDYKLLGDYLLDPSNYNLSNKQYRIDKVLAQAGVGTTHRFYLETEQKPTPCELSMSLINTSPYWISEYSMGPDKKNEIFTNLDKTFGIQTITDAVFGAYHYNVKELFTINVKINF